MKKLLISCALILITGWFAGVNGQGTASLEVTQLVGYPVVPDTAFEGVPYSVTVKISNNSSLAVNGTVDILLKTDSATVTLTSFGGLVLLPGDSTAQLIQTYNFTSQQYKAGNNIVVVWPVAQGAPAMPIDSLFSNVFFVPLAGVPVPEVPSASFSIYPIPTSHSICIQHDSGEPIEQVRIYNPEGRLATGWLFSKEGVIDVRNLRAGLYLIEIYSGKGKAIKRFIKID